MLVLMHVRTSASRFAPPLRLCVTQHVSRPSILPPSIKRFSVNRPVSTSASSNPMTNSAQEKQEKLKAYRREYRSRNKEKLKLYFAEYNKKNAAKVSEQKKTYRRENVDKLQSSKLDRKNRTKEEIKHSSAYKEKLEKLLHIQSPEDWYDMSARQLLSFPLGRKIFDKTFDKSMLSMLEALYPDQKWMHGRFTRCPQGTWKDREHLREYFRYLEPKLKIAEPSDWYRVSREQLVQFGSIGWTRALGTLHNALAFAFPEYAWDPAKFRWRGKKANQRWLILSLQSLLSENIKIIENFRHSSLLWEDNIPMELDVWVPDLNLALEYQGEQHYHQFRGAFGEDSVLRFTDRDLRKQHKCSEHGIKLVQIPYWWDGNMRTLWKLLEQHGVVINAGCGTHSNFSSIEDSR